MTKSTVLFLSFLLACTSAFAQQKMSLSDPFDEPDGLESKVVQCNNGNTFLFNFTKKDGIEITVFDKARKNIAHQTIAGKDYDDKLMAKSTIDGIYNMGGKLVLFLEQLDDKTPILYRLILDPANGNLVDEQKIHEMPRYAAGAGYAMAFGHVKPKGYFVEKDPNSDAYAVLAFDGFAEETAKRIELVHFSGTHKEISRSFYDAPENRFKYINFIGMVVDGEKQVFLCTYAYNTPAAGGAAARVILSRLTPDGKMEHHATPGTENWKDTKAIFTYNTGAKMLDLLTLTYMSTDNTTKVFGPRERTAHYRMRVGVIDPVTLNYVRNNPVNLQKVSEARRKKATDSDPYSGMPMNLVINPDNTITIPMEEMTSLETVSLVGTPNTKQGVELYDIGIIDVNNDGTETNGYAIRKSQKTRFAVPALAHAQYRKNIVTFEREPGFGGYANSGFYSYDYISTPSGRYVIFNDRPDNFDLKPKEDPAMVTGISDCNTVCYKLSNGKEEKTYLFGKPDDNFDNRFAFLTSGDYTDATGDYAVLMLEKTGRKKQARVAWVNLKS